MFGHKLIFTGRSKYSGRLNVYSDFGYKYISTGALTQSGGLVKDVWDPVLKKFARKNKSWLILGLSGGTAALIIAKKYHPARLVGVEIDPLMIELGQKYLNLSKIKNLDIIISDARAYIADSEEKFDYILVDMYLGDQIPEFVYASGFIKKLGQLGQFVIFNHLFYDQGKRFLAQKLVASLKSVFPRVDLMHKLTNLLIICSH